MTLQPNAVEAVDKGVGPLCTPAMPLSLISSGGNAAVAVFVLKIFCLKLVYNNSTNFTIFISVLWHFQKKTFKTLSIMMDKWP